MERERTQFCLECRMETRYRIEHVLCKKFIKDKEYVFEVSKAVCEKCGENVSIPGIIDSNTQEIDRQYRAQEGIISTDSIEKLMSVYNIGKAPLSLALGFGEITITRYLAGQVPSKEYSDVMKKALESPVFMIEKLKENKDRIGKTAFKKAIYAAKGLEPLFSLSEKMLLTISYIFKTAEEITPLALQKILYFIQGIYMVLFDDELFSEDCEAWTHGPVFKDVYDVFRNFRYNPIDDIRFAMFQNRFNELDINGKMVINLVVESFGLYSGKVLEQITHEETPWREARVNCLPGGRSNEIIPKETIKDYFSNVAEHYEINTINGLKNYINSKLQIVPCI